MKLNKKTAGAVIFLVLILLLFFSRTIYNYNMPEVTGTRPKRGSLTKLEISSGIAGWAEKETIYAVGAGAVGNVYVMEGDAVERGQILFEMDFDVPAAQRRLIETDNNIFRLETDIRGLQLRNESIRTALAAAYLDDSAPAGQAQPLTGLAGLIALELNRARNDYQNAQLSFDLGLQSRNSLLNAENNLRALYYKYETEADDLLHSIALKQMELVSLRLSRDTIQEMLRDYRNNAVVRAPADGIILELNAERGKFFPDNAFLVSIGIGREFIVECTISLDNNFVNPGDICELSNASHTLRGTVRRVRPSANGKTVTITVLSDEVNDGETFIVTFEKTGDSSFTLVPNSAINQDNDGYFLYQIKRRKGMMGDEYYVDRLNIFIGDSDHQNTIVIRGIVFFEPVVLVSNKILTAGQTVSLKNPGDFFEN